MAFTQQSGRTAWYEDQALTRAAPTTTADGVPLSPELDTLTLVVEADSGETISGGGAMRGYLYDDFVTAWVRCAELDWSTITAGARRVSINFVALGSRKGARVMWAADAVTVSGGTTVRVYILAGQDELDD